MNWDYCTIIGFRAQGDKNVLFVDERKTWLEEATHGRIFVTSSALACNAESSANTVHFG